MNKRNLMALLTTLVLSTGMMFSQVVGSGNPHGQTSLAVPVAGSFTAPTSGPLSSLSSLVSGTMAGTFNINKFVVQNNASGQPQLMAVGNLVATLTGTSGQAAQTVLLNNVVATVDPSGTCPVLTLTLAPLHLDLLGLVVDIPNPINLNIVAQSGPGNLLGNLLCDVTGLLNGGGALQTIATDLNQILAGLGL